MYDSSADERIAGSLSVSMADFFAQALDAAIALLHADGGELATLDTTREVLVLRARAKTPRVSGIGGASRSSQPLHPALQPSSSGHSRPSMPSGVSWDPGASGVGEPVEEYGVESQSTILLPAALSSRQYRRGEGLIGQVWQRGEATIMSGEEFRAQPHSSGSSGVDAASHLAVPIYWPGPLNIAPTAEDVIGVIAMYIRDPRWGFSKNHIELLELHADRVARSMRMADLARQSESRGALLEVLRTVDGSTPGLATLCPRVRDIVRHLIDAPSFAVALVERKPAYQRQFVDPDPIVHFALAERDGHQVAAEPRPASQMPPWWRALLGQQVVCVSTVEERVERPELTRLGFGVDQPVASVLAAPLVGGHGAILGAIVAGSPNPDAYGPEHIPLIETVAHAAAIVMENAWLAEDRERSLTLAEEKATNLAVLNNAVLTLNASLDMDTTLQAVTEQATRLTSAQACAIFLRDPLEKDLIWRPTRLAETGTGGPPPETRMPLDWYNIEQVMQTHQPFLVLDRLDSEWHDESSMGRWLAQNRIFSCLVLPMEHPDNAQDQPLEPDTRAARAPYIGVLVVYTPGRHQAFSPAETGLLQGLASQAAIAVGNAKLYEDLKTLDRLKDDFILTVSHEFRTPLTTIDGYVSLIGRHADKLDKERLAQYGREIRIATDQLASMINTLVDVNRMDSEPLKIELRPVSVRDVAERAIANYPLEAKQRVDDQIAEDLWVAGDVERLPTVFSNLVSNALKYGSETTPCRLTARIESRDALLAQGRKVPMEASAAQRWAVMGVRDFGIGIIEADQHKLFHKFVRLPQSLTTSVRGTGLGLWICKQYVTAMGGDIWVESAYSKGAHFQFCLPLAAAPSNE
jgi:signal transduction histidine kinase